ncbi:hypothetical protein [Larkinella soli]|uniref:hypothetical protein n=1 Tax=Larkinella soli TaxID=1770527 RepID=UPI000FFCB309|nr:hypothetical protein [Larkinella soli]
MNTIENRINELQNQIELLSGRIDRLREEAAGPNHPPDRPLMRRPAAAPNRSGRPERGLDRYRALHRSARNPVRPHYAW